MNAKRIQPVFIEIITALLVLIFLYTAIMKLRDIPSFIGAMSHTEIIGPYANSLAWLVPGLELSASILLIIPQSRFYGLVFSTALMGIFTVYVSYILLSLENLPCSCGGVIEQMGWEEHLAMNAVLFLGGIISIVFHKNIIAINRRRRKPEI